MNWACSVAFVLFAEVAKTLVDQDCVLTGLDEVDGLKDGHVLYLLGHHLSVKT